jgi:hypothetical protein
MNANPGRSAFVLTAGVVAFVWLANPGKAQATPQQYRSDPAGLAARAHAEFARFVRTTSSARPVAPAIKAKAASGNSRGAKPALGTRSNKPLITVTSAGAGQGGYVHFFLLRSPDESLEVQVGIELPDQRIAWSFPDLGVTVSPFIEAGVIRAGGKDYELWHLYGIRPFPDDAAMAALQKELAARIDPWVKARTPYCLHDGPRSNCMSCLGFVLRALFPGRNSDYPDLPRDFWRAGIASRYTTSDLLLYLTGMLDLPTRQARLQRIARLELPDHLRRDLEELVYSMGPTESAPAPRAGTAPGSPQKRPEPRPPRVGTRPTQRSKL